MLRAISETPVACAPGRQEARVGQQTAALRHRQRRPHEVRGRRLGRRRDAVNLRGERRVDERRARREQLRQGAVPDVKSRNRCASVCMSANSSAVAVGHDARVDQRRPEAGSAVKYVSMTFVSHARAAGVASSLSTCGPTVSGVSVPARAASSSGWSGGPSVRKNESALASSYGVSGAAASAADARRRIAHLGPVEERRRDQDRRHHLPHGFFDRRRGARARVARVDVAALDVCRAAGDTPSPRTRRGRSSRTRPSPVPRTSSGPRNCRTRTWRRGGRG